MLSARQRHQLIVGLLAIVGGNGGSNFDADWCRIHHVGITLGDPEGTAKLPAILFFKDTAEGLGGGFTFHFVELRVLHQPGAELVLSKAVVALSIICLQIAAMPPSALAMALSSSVLFIGVCSFFVNRLLP